jgi:hypothetical protein
MRKRYLWTALAVAISAVTIGGPASAGVTMFTLHDHPNGQINPPTYGLRLDDLLASGEYTFSFDYVDMSGAAGVVLAYDDVNNTIHISGRAYGGKDIGGAWDGAESGWIDIDFLFAANVAERDNCAGAAGNDLYVTGESLANNGTISLDGWGGDQVFSFTDKADGSGCTFVFDNDTDSKGNAGIANDPSMWSGSGWLMPPTSGSRDWLFIGEMQSLPTEEATWGKVKALYRK